MAADGSSAARQQRILNHVNRDHKEALSHYLPHFANVPAAAASTPSSPPELLDVSLEQMIIRAGDGQVHTVDFAPPLSAWDEMRVRLVEMDSDARDALYDVTITEWAPPQGVAAVVFCAVGFYFLSYASLPLVVPGTTPWRILESVFPGGAATFRWLVKAIFFPVLGIHIVEAVALDQTRLQRHNVPRWSKLWWQWELNMFVEGFTCWKRIDAMVEAKKAAKAQKTE
jgi:hypothetical protein